MSPSLIVIITWFGATLPLGVLVGKLLAGAAGVLDETLAGGTRRDDDAVVSACLV